MIKSLEIYLPWIFSKYIHFWMFSKYIQFWLFLKYLHFWIYYYICFFLKKMKTYVIWSSIFQWKKHLKEIYAFLKNENLLYLCLNSSMKKKHLKEIMLFLLNAILIISINFKKKYFKNRLLYFILFGCFQNTSIFECFQNT